VCVCVIHLVHCLFESKSCATPSNKTTTQSHHHLLHDLHLLTENFFSRLTQPLRFEILPILLLYRECCTSWFIQSFTVVLASLQAFLLASRLTIQAPHHPLRHFLPTRNLLHDHFFIANSLNTLAFLFALQPSRLTVSQTAKQNWPR
jgi:uncharacterized membrane protein